MCGVFYTAQHSQVGVSSCPVQPQLRPGSYNLWCLMHSERVSFCVDFIFLVVQSSGASYSFYSTRKNAGIHKRPYIFAPGLSDGFDISIPSRIQPEVGSLLHSPCRWTRAPIGLEVSDLRTDTAHDNLHPSIFSQDFRPPLLLSADQFSTQRWFVAWFCVFGRSPRPSVPPWRFIQRERKRRKNLFIETWQGSFHQPKKNGCSSEIISPYLFTSPPGMSFCPTCFFKLNNFLNIRIFSIDTVTC